MVRDCLRAWIQTLQLKVLCVNARLERNWNRRKKNMNISTWFQLPGWEPQKIAIIIREVALCKTTNLGSLRRYELRCLVILSINHGNLRLPRYQMPHTPPGHKAVLRDYQPSWLQGCCSCWDSSHFDEMLSESWEVLLPRICWWNDSWIFGSKVDDDFHGKRGTFMHIEAVVFWRYQ